MKKIVFQIENQFKKWLQENEDLAFIKIGRFDNPNLLINGILESNAMIFRTKGKEKIYPFLEELNDDNFLEIFVSSLKIILADYLAITGRRQTALNVITHFLINNCPINSTAVFFFHSQPWINEYFFRKRDLEIFEIADNLLDLKNPNLANTLAFASQILGSSVFSQKKYHQFCIKSFEVATDNKSKGIASYNLASSFKSLDLFQKAVIYYCKAATFAPKYLEKSYWWAEIAGCFFLLNKFLWAEHCYKKAVELKEERIPVRYLLGDTLLYQGRFEDASKELAAYLAETEKPVADAMLKKWLSDFLLVNFGDTKINIAKSDELVEKALELKNSEDAANLYFEALKQNPLSDLAWYNYRVSESSSSLNQSSFYLWLASIITNPNDTESWAFFIALIMFEFPKIHEIEDELKYIQLAVISEACKHKVKLEVAIRNNMPEEFAQTTIELIEDLNKKANGVFYQDPPFVMRPF